MATYSIEDALTPQKKTYSLSDVIQEKPKSSILDTIGNAAKLAFNASPLGILQQVNNLGNQVVDKERNFLGDKTLEATGSPAAATAAYMAPDIANLAVGLGLNRIPQKVASNNVLGQAAERVGFNPTWGQRTQRPTLLQVEDTLRRMPVSGGVFATNDARNTQAVNRAVSNAIGQDSNAVTGEVLANATDDLGNARNALREKVSIPQNASNILSTIDSATQELKRGLRGIGSWTKDTGNIKQALQEGNISGDQYQIWRTDLRDAANSAYKAGKTKLGDAYKSVVGALDDAARGNAGEAWKANDKAFSTLNMIQEGNIINPVTGNVSAPLLANKFFQTFGKTAKQGKLPGEINDIATLQRGYPLWREGSPTAKAEMFDSLVPWLMSPATGGLAKLLTSDPSLAARYLTYGNALPVGLLGTDQ